MASPEMLYVSGSSGAQFDERAAKLRETDDVVTAIATAISERDHKASGHGALDTSNVPKGFELANY